MKISKFNHLMMGLQPRVLSILMLGLLLTMMHHVRSLERLEFVKVPGATTDAYVYLTNKVPHALLDATSPSHRIVYLLERHKVMYQTVELACQVNKQINPLSRINLCCRTSAHSSERHCEKIPLGQPAGSVSCLQNTFTYTRDLLNGVNFTLKLSSKTSSVQPASGLFYCSVYSSSMVMVESNEVELRDAVFYLEKLPVQQSTNVEVRASLKPSEFPIVFTCVDYDNKHYDWPQWMSLFEGLAGPYQWGYCDVVGSMNAVTCVESFAPLSAADAISYLNGTLFLLNSDLFLRQNRALSCKMRDQVAPIVTFAGKTQGSGPPKILEGLRIDDSSQPDPSINKLAPLVQLVQNHTLIDGTVLPGFQLRALYREPREGSVYEWHQDDQLLPKKFATKFSYDLSRTVDETFSGAYKLIVTSTADPSDVLTFVHNVQVVAPPKYTDGMCLPSLFYIMEQGNYTKFCSFYSTSKSDVLIGVNGYEAYSDEDLRRLLVNELQFQNKPLSMLDIRFETTEGLASRHVVHINFTALQRQQDFKLSVKIENTEGQAHVLGDIRVIPKPLFQVAPSSQACSKDCDQTPFNVTCVLDPDLIKAWRDEFNVVMLQEWVIQENWSTAKLSPQGIGRFIRINHTNPSVLSIWPNGREVGPQPEPSQPDEENDIEKVTTSQPPIVVTPASQANTLKQFLAQTLGGETAIAPSDLILRCWIRLFVLEEEAQFDPPHPAANMLRVPRQSVRDRISGTTLSGSRLIYDSNWETDAKLNSLFQVKRAFTPDPGAAMASLAWIAAVVLGIIVVIAVIVLSVWLCTRDRGETYRLYDKERAHGNDPLQEFKEKETFQTFDRQEEAPIHSTRYSLHDGSAHVESDDDGELDAYSANFNEEGSFIGQYRTNDGTVGVLPRPRQVKGNAVDQML